MGTYKKIPAKYKKNTKGIRLHEGGSDEKLRKYGSGNYWIRDRKRTYLYWYKFLQICLQKKLPIERNKYRGWDLDTILDTKFDVWWISHWEKLFGVPNRTDIPKFSTSSTRIKIDSVRFSYLVCCINENLSFWKHGKLKQYKGKSKYIRIAYEIIKYDLNNRYPTDSNIFYPLDNDSKPVHPDDLLLDKKKSKSEWDPDDDFDKVLLERKGTTKLEDEDFNLPDPNDVVKQKNKTVRDEITERITKHRHRYEKIIKNVCNGIFP
jgi:hypothetical protein